MLMRIASVPESAFSTTELADEFQLSGNHLSKTTRRLAAGGVVVTRLGGGGDATLAPPASEIRLGKIVCLLEDGQPLVECFSANGGDCSITGHCKLKAKLRSAEEAFLADLDRATLVDIVLALPLTMKERQYIGNCNT